MESQVTSWLNEGLRHYSAGDASRALEAWYRILEVEPDHPAALEYVSFVREALSAEPAPPSTPPAPVTAPRRDTVDDFHWADVVGPVTPSPPPPRVPEAVPLAEPAAVEATPAPVASAAPAAVASAGDAGDDGVDIDIDMASPADDERPRLPTIIIEGMDVEPPPPSVADPFVDIQPARNGTGEISVAEIMPPPDPVSASRPIPRRPTPTPAPTPVVTQPPPSPAFDFDALVRDTPTAPIEPPALEPPAPPPIVVAPAAPIILVEAPRLRTPSAPLKVAPRTRTPTAPIPAVPLEERVIRQSIRFDEPRGVTMGPAPSQPLSSSMSSELAAVAAQAAPVEPVVDVAVAPAAPAAVAEEAASPWDDAVGPAQPLDLDTAARPPSAFDALLRDATAAMVIAERVEDVPEAPEPAPAPVDELTALMTGAKELFELGDFSGSLELVEKVLRRNPQHEGALAYLKRNEATLLRMYESKIGDMSKIPKPLVPPDEVIWMNMHHRAGFILSQVDGTLSYDDLLEISGMDRFDTVRIVADLVTAGIIG